MANEPYTIIHVPKGNDDAVNLETEMLERKAEYWRNVAYDYRERIENMANAANKHGHLTFVLPNGERVNMMKAPTSST